MIRKKQNTIMKRTSHKLFQTGKIWQNTIFNLVVLSLASCSSAPTLSKVPFDRYEGKGVFSPYTFSLNDSSLKPPLPSLHKEDESSNLNYLNILVIPVSFDGGNLSKEELEYCYNGPVDYDQSVTDIFKSNSNGKCLLRFAIADTAVEKRPDTFDPYAFPSDFLPRWLEENEVLYPMEKFDSDDSGGYDCIILEDVSKTHSIDVNGFYPPNIDKVDGLILIDDSSSGVIAHEIGHALGLPDTYESFVEEGYGKVHHLPLGSVFVMDGAKTAFTDFEKWVLSWEEPNFFAEKELTYTLSEDHPCLFYPVIGNTGNPYGEYLVFSYYDSRNPFMPGFINYGDEIGVYITHVDGRLYDKENHCFASSPSKNVSWAFTNHREGKIEGLTNHPQQSILYNDASDYDYIAKKESSGEWLLTTVSLFKDGVTFNPNRDYLLYGEDNSHTEQFGYSVAFSEEDDHGMKITFTE